MTGKILFAECKWQEKVNPGKVCRDLVEKSKYVDWRNGRREEHFAVFARSFSRKMDEFEGRRVFCFDLKDMERILK
ncbi:hypothetical protein [Candidatus Pyrohabitans sp.]